MSRIFATNPIKVHCLPGERIDHALLDALRLSEQLEAEIILEFNGKQISCHYRHNTVKELIETYLSKD